jgi:hypothetical protein
MAKQYMFDFSHFFCNHPIFVSTYDGSFTWSATEINTTQPDLNDNWTNVSYKRRRSAEEETKREAKHTYESETWLN